VTDSTKKVVRSLCAAYACSSKVATGRPEVKTKSFAAQISRFLSSNSSDVRIQSFSNISSTACRTAELEPNVTPEPEGSLVKKAEAFCVRNALIVSISVMTAG
jgi:hypothetical protein